MSDLYYVSVTGSQDPPKGPYAQSKVEAELLAGRISSDAIVCKVGDTTWSPVSKLVPPKREPEPTKAAAGVLLSAAALAARYKNLSKLSTSLSGTGSAIQLLALVFFIVAVTAGIYTFANNPLLGAGCAFTAILALPVYAIGVLIAATGEALLALRDIAINTTPVTIAP